jgi:TonB dependent receptor/TonB-dependent Receptor Plug Domain
MVQRVAAVIIACAAVAHADPTRIVRGVVTIAHSATPIGGASVLGEHGDIVVTDVDGYFTLHLDASARELTVVATGYSMRTVAVRDDLLHIELVPTSGELIEVSGTAPDDTKPLSYQLTAAEIRTIPGAGNDILRAAQILPGVSRIPYSFGGLVLRGSSPRDTEVYLDGIEVPIAFHFGGITSFYPGGMLSDLQLTAGGFDASYGRAQGGLVTLETREPRTDRWRVGGEIGVLDSAVEAEGPLPKGGGIIIGIRRSYFDTLATPFVTSDTPLPSYWDFQLRTSWGDPRDEGRITPMIFGSIDRIASDTVSITSAFLRVAAPYLRQWGPFTLHVVPWLGVNELSFHDDTDPDDNQTFARPTYLGGVRADLTRDYPWGDVRGGLELSSGYLSHAQVGVQTQDGDGMQTDGTSTIDWADVAAFAETRIKLDGDRFSLKPGLRIERYGLTGETVVDPRINITHRLDSRFTLREAFGRYHQPPTPGDVDPLDGNPNLTSSFVDQYSIGVDADLGHTFASLTGFYNYGIGIGVPTLDPAPGSSLPQPSFGGLGPTFQLLLEKQLGFPVYRSATGLARSYGVEVLVKRTVGRYFGLVSYTLSKSERTDDPLQNVGWRPFELDQRHNLNVAGSIQLSHWRFGARIQLVSGNPYSPTTFVNGVPVQQPWAANLPVFFQLDLRADRRWHRCWGDINFFIDIQNATDQNNVEGREFDTGTGRDLDVPGLPIIPFIGVEFLPLI